MVSHATTAPWADMTGRCSKLCVSLSEQPLRTPAQSYHQHRHLLSSSAAVTLNMLVVKCSYLEDRPEYFGNPKVFLRQPQVMRVMHVQYLP